MNGRTGADEMTGGTGDDSYYADDFGDVITEAAGEGTDTIRVSITGFELYENVEIGILTKTDGGTLGGNNGDNLLIGNAGDDALYGGPGNDTLKGGGGVDELVGGVGDDIYYVDRPGGIAADAVYELTGEGIDTVRYAGGIYQMADNVENAIV